MVDKVEFSQYILCLKMFKFMETYIWAHTGYNYIIIPLPNEVGGEGCTGFILSICLSICQHGLQSKTQVCFGISISNFMCMFFVAMGISLLIFSDVTFKMVTWQPYWIVWFPDSLLWLSISSPNFTGTSLMYMGISLLIFITFKMAAQQPYWILWYLEFALEFQL